MDFVKTCKIYKRAWNQKEKVKLVPNIDYANDLTVLVEKVSKMIDFRKVLRVKGAKINFEN
jgi:hypothetical protein